MAYSDKYERQFDYFSYQTANPTRPLPGDKVNVDFNYVVDSISQLVDFQKVALDSSGNIKGGSITTTMLSTAVRAMIGDVDAFDELYAELADAVAGASGSATAASTSATNAAASATAAAGSATAAAGSAASAAGSATAASTSATNAATSATAAAASATDAANAMVGGVNLRSSSETAYTIVASDKNKTVVARNDSAAAIWSLQDPTGSFVGFGFTARNGGYAPVTIKLTGTALVNRQKAVVLGWGEAARIVADTEGNYQAVIFPSPGQSDLCLNCVAAPSYSVATLPNSILLSGTVTAGDVVGFDYTLTISGSPTTLQFRHTMQVGDTLETAVRDLGAQVRANVTLQAQIGYDIVSHAVELKVGSNWGLYFNNSWPMILPGNGNPSITARMSGGSTTTVSTQLGSDTLEFTSELIIGTSARWSGRTPKAGDILGGIIATGDTLTHSMTIRDAAPFYGQMVWSILDPTDGVTTARLNFLTADHRFQGQVTTTAGIPLGVGTVTPQAMAHINKNVVSNLTGSNTPILLLTGADGGGVSSIETATFGGQSSHTGRRANGTGSSPTTLVSGNVITNLNAMGYDGTSYASVANISAIATQNWTGAAHGTTLTFYATPDGSTTLTEVFRTAPGGNLKFSAAANFSANGSVATTLGSVGPSGANTTVQKWLTIVDNTGATRYIPCF